ncbi:hypothetical protein BB561_003115 [Smittium simulii]|uniref:XPG-I domain-containing protein n=1 Tax=Smittium simulii TaxID=133385 RepID=A0A2T9YMW9_9FUNG|nr:hypothetical protein BB561_003115 [Smittium simulii]
MGVASLWKLVEHDLNPVQLTSLEKKKFAVDASIWIHQFMKATISNNENDTEILHIIGFFRRVCKLLHFGIFPLFVFDGSPPELKKKTLEQRRFRRETQEFNAKLAAEKLLSAKLHAHVAKNIANDTNKNATTRSNINSDSPDKISNSLSSSLKRTREGFDLPDIHKDNKYAFVVGENSKSKTDLRMPTKEEFDSAESWGKAITGRKTISGYDAGIFDFDNSSIYEENKQSPTGANKNEKVLGEFFEKFLNSFEFDSEEFLDLPIETQHTILKRLKDYSRQTSFKRLKKMVFESKTAMDFSQMQVEDLMNRNKLMQNLLEVSGAKHRVMSLDNKSNIIRNSVASQRGVEYMLYRSDVPGGGYKLSAPANFIIKDEPSDITPVKVTIESKSIESSDDSFECDDFSSQTHFTPEDFIKSQLSPNLSISTPTKKIAGNILLDKIPLRKINSPDTEDSLDEFEDVPISAEKAESFENIELLDESINHSVSLDDESDQDHSELKKLLDNVNILGTFENNMILQNKNTIKTDSYNFIDLSDSESDALSDKGASDFFENSIELKSFEPSLENSILCKTTNDFSNSSTIPYIETTTQKPITPEIPKINIFSKEYINPTQDSQIKTGNSSVFGGSSFLKLKKNVANETDKPIILDESTMNNKNDNLTELKLNSKTDVDSENYKQICIINEEKNRENSLKEPIPKKNLPNDYDNFIDTTIEKKTNQITPITKAVRNEKNPESIGLDNVLDLKNSEFLSPSASTDSKKQKNPINFMSEKTTHNNLKTPTSNNSTRISNDSPFSPSSIETILSNRKLEIKSSISPKAQGRKDDNITAKNSGVINLNKDFIEEQIKQNQLELLKAKRNATSISSSQLDDIRVLLEAFGIPYITAPSEAEATCAYLEQQRHVDGVITDDSDVLLFGATNVYKNFFNLDKTVIKYQKNTTSRLDMIFYAYFLGSDYTVGVNGVGPTTVKVIYKFFGSIDSILETSKYINPEETEYFKIITEMRDSIPTSYNAEQQIKNLISQLNCFQEFMNLSKKKLIKFKNDSPPTLLKLSRLSLRISFPLDFPDINVARGYLSPNVSDLQALVSDYGETGIENDALNLIQTYMNDKSIWDETKINAMVLPLIKKMISDKKNAANNKNQSRQVLLGEAFNNKLSHKQISNNAKKTDSSTPSWFL